MEKPLPILNPVRRNFRMEVFSKLKHKEALTLLDVSVGYVYDILKTTVKGHTFKAAFDGKAVTVAIMDDPIGVVIDCGDYNFEFDRLTKSISTYGYYRDAVLPDNTELVDATAAILESMYQLITEKNLPLTGMIGNWYAA